MEHRNDWNSDRAEAIRLLQEAQAKIQALCGQIAGAGGEQRPDAEVMHRAYGEIALLVARSVDTVFPHCARPKFF